MLEEQQRLGAAAAHRRRVTPPCTQSLIRAAQMAEGLLPPGGTGTPQP